MPAIGRNVASPYNPGNFVIPNRLSIWFAPFDAKGAQTAFFELGDVSDIEIDLTETFLDKKSARQGVMTTVKRAISDQEGAISFALGEVVGRNLELLFRPSEIRRLDGAGNNPEAIVFEQTRPRLIGTTASEIAPGIAMESGPGGTLFNRELTITAVTNLDGSVEYAATDDYTFNQANEGEHSVHEQTVGGATATMGNTLTITEDDGSTTVLTVGTEIPTAASAAALAANIAQAINTYSSSYVAEAVGADLTIAHISLDGGTAAAIAVTGTELVADLGGATLTFAAGTATTPATIARVVSGSIPDGAEVVVRFSFNRRGIEYRIQAGLTLEGALRVQALSVAGPQAFYEFPRVSLSLEDAISLNPEEFQTANLTATILTDGSGVRGRYTQLCTYSDFFVEAAASACPAAAIVAPE